jgi:hypothetical protein
MVPRDYIGDFERAAITSSVLADHIFGRRIYCEEVSLRIVISRLMSRGQRALRILSAQ